MRGLLLQDKSVVEKPYTATSCRNSSLFERTVRITEFSRTCAEKIDKLGDAGAVIPSYVRIERFRAGTFDMSPTALEISESNLATFFRKLRRAPMRDWSETL